MYVGNTCIHTHKENTLGFEVSLFGLQSLRILDVAAVVSSVSRLRNVSMLSLEPTIIPRGTRL